MAPEYNVYYLFSVAACILVGGYTAHCLKKGRPRFERVERSAGSWLLGKRIMEIGYWGIQPLSRPLLFFSITPNQMSWSSILFGLLSGSSLASGRFGLGAIFGTVAALLDTLDGMVARASRQVTETGDVLDSVLDRYVEFFFLAGLIVYYRNAFPVQLLAVVALFGSLMVSYSSLMAVAKKITIRPSKATMKRPERLVYLLLGAALSPIPFPSLESLHEYPITLNYPMVFALALVAVFANICAIGQFSQIIRGVRVRVDDSHKIIDN